MTNRTEPQSGSLPARMARLLALALALAILPAAAAVPQLLRPLPSAPAPKAALAKIEAPGIPVALNTSELKGMRAGDEVQLTLPTGIAHDYVFDLVQDHGNGIVSWVGRHKSLGKQHRIVITTGPGGSYATISTPEREYRLVPAGSHDWLVDMTEEQLRLPIMDLGVDYLFPPPRPKGFAEPTAAPETITAIEGVNTPFVGKSTPAPQYVVDLMIVYTNGLAASLGSNLQTRLNFLVTRSNTAYADSEIAITLRLVNSTQVTYSDATDNSTALNAITPASGTYDGVTFGTIETIRTSVGADLVALLRNGGTFSGSGVAWVGSTSPNPAYMYSVITGCTAGCESVFIHELGHNMGNMHDRSTSSWQAGGTPTPPQGAFPYSYGYAFCLSGALSCNPTIPTGSGGCSTQPECSTSSPSNFSDIMAYFHGTTERQYKFSNPNITCTTSGDATARPCGVSEAAGNSANTALSMNNNRAALSAIKATMVGSSLQLTQDTVAAAESAGTLSFTVSRTGSSTGAVSVNYATSSGSALAGSDFTSTSGTLNWADGDTANKTINVPIANDGLVENSETFTVTLSGPSPTGGATGAVLGSPSTATGLIMSPFPTGGVFPAGFVTPGGSSGAWTVVTDQFYEGTNSLGSAKVVSPTFDVPIYSDMSYVGDFVTGRVVFAYRISSYQNYSAFEFSIDGVVVASDPGGESGWKLVSVPITAGSHTLQWRFMNKLNAPCNAGWTPPPAGGASCADRVWIDALALPTNPIPFLAFSSASYPVTEGTPSVTVTVNRSVELAGAVAVNYATVNGTAIAGTHYTAASGTLTWADSDGTSRDIVIPIADDSVVNAARTFTVSLSGAVGANSGTPATVTIADNDNNVQFASATANVTEGAPSVIVAVTRTGGTALAASVDWSTVDGTALAGTDFGTNGVPSPVTGTINWSAGDGTSKNISIPILNDAILEPTKSFSIALGNPTGSGTSLGTPATAAVTLLDDEAALAFASATYMVNEAGPNIAVTVNRTGATTNAVSVTWTTASGTAVAGQDYGTSGSATQRTGTLSWAAGDAAAKTITVGPTGTVPIINDAVVEGAEDFTITLSSPTGGALIGATGTTSVTVVDNESTVEFSPAALTVSEAGPNGVLTVTRTGSTTAAASVTWTTASGTAVIGSDFGTSGSAVQKTGTLSWGAGDGSPKTISVGPTTTGGAWIPILNDALIEGPETFTVTLSAPTGSMVLGTATATVTIDSNDVGVTMASSALAVTESSGVASVQVNRSGSSSGAISVNYATANSSALAGSHYTATSGTLNWADGDAAPKFINVPIIDNSAVNTARVFTVALSGAVGVTIGAPASTTVTINDDDNTLQFSAATATVNENAGTLSLTVTRLGGTAGAASVNWSTADGTALAGSDFGTLGNAAPVTGTLNWAPGDAASKTIVIPILNDAIVESTESFTVSLSGASGTGTSIGATPTVTVTITDDEASLNFSSATYSVNEAGPNATITVTRAGAAAAAVSVTWTTGNGTAIAGQDFGTSGSATQRTGTLSWLAGDTAAKTITVGPTTATGSFVPILNDSTVEGDETFTITLSAPTGGAVLGPTSVATVTIVDNDSTVAFSPTTLTVSEAGPNGTLTVTRTGSAATAATVTWTTANGTATAGSDFGTSGSTVQKTGTLSWAAGDGAPKTIAVGPTTATGSWIPVINDTLIEGPETFTVTLSAPTGGAVIGAGSATVTIDSDDRGITMASATQSVAESAGSVTVNVNRSGSSTGAVSVNYATANGTATTPAHYTAASGTLNWADGDTAPKPIVIPVIDNGAVNTARTFNVTLSGAVGATLGTPVTTTVTIADDDNTLQFSAATATVAEGTASVTLSVTRLGGPAATASVDWATADGTAAAGSDFGTLGNATPLSGTLNWGAGDAATKSIVIPILNDLVVEGAKTFTVNLTNPSGTGASIGTIATATVTINDNDAGVVLSAANYNVNETGGTVTITVNRIGPATAAASVGWITSNGTATAGQDFGTLGSALQKSGTLSWAAGNAAAKSFTIAILNDALSEGTETFTVTLQTPSAGIVLGTPSSATVTIVDDEIPPESTIQFSTDKTTVSEGAGSVDLTVTRVGSGYTFAGSVSYATAAATALATSDFTTRSGTLTWGSGDSTPRTITVPITNDAVAEGPEHFKVTLSAPTPGLGLGAPSSTTVLIEDDDEIFPPQGNMPAGWTMPGTANAGWHVNNDAGAYEGMLQLRSDTAFDNEVAQVEVAGNWLAGSVSFRVKVSSEPGFDFLRFYVDGVKVGEWSGTTVTTWTLFSVAVPAGAHTFRWSYEKDGSGSFGQDAAWIDAVTLPAAGP